MARSRQWIAAVNLRINQNLAAAIALGGVRSHQASFNASAERLATGRRVNRASDDLADFVGIDAMRGELKGIGAAIKNTLLARNTLSVAQNGLSQIHDRLNRLRAVALKALGGDIATTDRSILQDEAEELLADIDRIVRNTTLGGNRVLDGSGDFFIEQTDRAFDDIRVKRLTFDRAASRRDFTVDVTRVAERATIITNLDLASTSPLTLTTASSLSISGSRGNAQIAVSPSSTAADLLAQINGMAEATGVFASSRVVNGAESAVTTLDIDADLELTGGNTFTMNVSVGGSVQTVTVTATGDVDADMNVEVTTADLERGLNDAQLGHFSVLSGDLAGNRNFIIRHAGASDFVLDNFADGTGTLQGALAGAGFSITGTQPAAARIVSDALTFDATARAANFDVKFFRGTAASTLNITNLVGTTANYNNGADLQTALNGIATVTHLGVNGNGQDIFLFTAAAGVDAFRFSEASTNSVDARDIGLLSHSGGGDGLASQGMGVLALYSDGFGSDQSVNLRNAGDSVLTFSPLNETDPDTPGLPVGSGETSAWGVDGVAFIDGQRIVGRGFHFAYSTGVASIEFDLSARFAPGSETNAINRALNLNYADPTAENLFGFRPITQFYDGAYHALTNLADGTGQQMIADGVIDRVTFSVHSTVADSKRRSGLGVQLTGELGGREFIGIRNFDISFLGGLPSAESGPGSMANALLKGAGTLSQLRRGGNFSLEFEPARITDTMAIIDRAISQTLRTRTQLGVYETTTLDSNLDFLSAMEAKLDQGRNDIETVDIAKEYTAMSLAQLRMAAATSVLAQANSIPQTLLTLLR